MTLDKELKKALADRLEGWEVVEYLKIDTDYIIELLEQEIIDNLEEIKELAGLVDDESFDNYDD